MPDTKSKLESGKTPIFNFDAIPKRDITFDTSCQWAWMSIVPGSIFIRPAFDLKVIVTCQPLPKTQGVCFTLPEILTMDCFRRKVIVPFYHHTLLALSKYDTIPTGCYHSRSSLLALVSLETFSLLVVATTE